VNFNILFYGAIALVVVVGISSIALSAHRAMSRQPEVQDRAFIVMVLGAAMCELMGLLGFVLALIG